MTELGLIKRDLVSLKAELLEFIMSEDLSHDLTQKFVNAKDGDPAMYELVSLIYDEFKTASALNKKQMCGIVNKSIDAKIKTVDKMILEKASMVKPKSKKSSSRSIIDRIKWTDVWKAVGTALFVLTSLAFLYKKMPEEMSSIVNDSTKVMQVAKDK